MNTQGGTGLVPPPGGEMQSPLAKCQPLENKAKVLCT